jgi:hypothetical protein
MLSTPVAGSDLRPGWAGEPKWDGFRALVSVDAGRVVLRSRRGTEMAPAFPEVVAGAGQLPDATAMDASWSYGIPRVGSPSSGCKAAGRRLRAVGEGLVAVQGA